MKSFFAVMTPARGAAEAPAARPARRSASSSTVAIATATVFVLLTAAVGLALDRPPSALGAFGTGWHLRGSLGAIGTVLPRPGRA